MSKKWLIGLASGAIVLAVSAGAFYGGMLFERSRQSTVQAQFFSERGGMPGGGQPMMGFSGGEGPEGQPPQAIQFGMNRGAAGTIASVEADRLTLTTEQGTTTVLLTEGTTIRKLVDGEPADLQPGLTVTVTGERDDQDLLTADSIQIIPELPQAGQ